MKSDGAIQPGRSRVGRLVEVATRLRFPLAVYLASRLLLIGVALFDGAVFHRSLAAELSNWDGVWYLRVATRSVPIDCRARQVDARVLPAVPDGDVGGEPRAVHPTHAGGAPHFGNWRIRVGRARDKAGEAVVG